MYDYNRFDLLLKQRLHSLIENEEAVLLKLQNELNSSRGGNLYVKRTKNKVFYTEYSHGKEVGIGHNKDRVHRLARRNYVSNQYKLARSYIARLKHIYDNLNTDKSIASISGKLDQYASLNLDMSKILFSYREQQWLNQPYERNPAYPEGLKFTSDNGILMRTKSELIIANRLEHYNIPYLPEMPLWFPYNLHPKYPDFTILKPNGETIIWEHMGRMDKEDYFIKNSCKIIEYRQNGYSQNTNLIITFEEDIIEPGMIDHIIETRILL